MSRPFSRSPERGAVLWNLSLALFVALCAGVAAYFHRSLFSGRHGSPGPDHDLGEAVIAGVSAFIVLLWTLFWGTRKTDSPKRKALEAAFYGVAGRLGGTVVPALWPQPPRIHFPSHGRSATLEFCPGDSRDGMTRVSVDLKDCSPGMMMIFRDNLRSLLPRLFGAQDLQIGDPSFDQRYILQANPVSVVQQVFHADRRARMMEAVSRLDRFPGATIHLTHESLTVRTSGYLSQEAELWALARTALEFTRTILDLEPPAPITWGDTSSSGGDCRICGSPLTSGVVRCSRCQTPHHGECWKYNGGCSIFACGEHRFAPPP